MTSNKVWFITGTGRGMGVEFAKAALAGGHSVVATGRNIETVRTAVGAHDELLVVKLDITDPASAKDAVEAAMKRFGQIDVLVNNAGNFYAGFFRTVLIEAASTIWAELSIDDYAERTAQTRPAWQAMSGRQSNDPAKLAKALVKLVDSGQPPLRWVAGADALPTAEQKARDLLGQIEAHRDLSASLTYDDALPTKS